MLGEQDKGHSAPGVQELREKLGGCGVPGLMFKQHQPIVTALQHRLSFFQRPRMVEFRRQRAPVAVQDFPDEKEILLLASHQQDTQKREPGLCRG